MPIHTRMTALAGMALATALGCGAAVAADCTPAHKIDSTVSPGKLTVAIYEYPPFAVTAGGQIGGVDGEILKSIAAAECLAFTPVVVDPAATIQYVLAGKADVAAGDWYRTAERAKVLGLTAPDYLDQMGIYSKDGVSTVAAMIGKQVGTVSGFLWVVELQKLLGTNLRLYPNPVALAQDLEAGRVQIGVDSYGTGAYAQKRGGYAGIIIKVAEPDERVQASIQAAQSGFPYTKANTSLGAAMDADIVAMHADGKIAGFLKSFGLDPSGADVGEPRLVK
jgi:polar amino acid transport system substrate-binding protein